MSFAWIYTYACLIFMVSLDKELIENLEKMAKNVEQKEQSMKIDLDGIINQMINE